jgi:hypothetical protein
MMVLTTIKLGVRQLEQMSCCSYCFPPFGRDYVWQHKPECLFSTGRHDKGGVPWFHGQQCHGILLVPVLAFMAVLLQRSMYTGWLGNQMHHRIQMLFPNKRALFKDDNALIHTAGTDQSYNCTGDCSKLVWAHSKNDCGFVEGKKKCGPTIY